MLLSHQRSKFSCQTLLSLVTISTLTVWSKAPQTHSPFLSGLQSRLEIGCVDRVTFCKRLTEPATPISAPSESFLERWAGYSLAIRKVKHSLNIYWYKHVVIILFAKDHTKGAVLKARQRNIFQIMSHHIQLYPCYILNKCFMRKQWGRKFWILARLSYSPLFFNSLA